MPPVKSAAIVNLLIFSTSPIVQSATVCQSGTLDNQCFEDQDDVSSLVQTSFQLSSQHSKGSVGQSKTALGTTQTEVQRQETNIENLEQAVLKAKADVKHQEQALLKAKADVKRLEQSLVKAKVLLSGTRSTAIPDSPPVFVQLNSTNTYNPDDSDHGEDKDNSDGSTEDALDKMEEAVKEDITMPASSWLSMNPLNLVIVNTLVVLSCCCISSHGKMEELNGRDVPEHHAKDILDHPALWKDKDTLSKLTEGSLEQERCMDISWWSLFRNIPWRHQPGPEQHAPKLSTNAEWLEGKPFPNGETRTHNNFFMTFALFAFLFKKKKPYMPLLYEVLSGVLGAIRPMIYQWIVDAIAQSGAEARNALLNYVLMYLALKVAEEQVNFKFMASHGTAGVRWELRTRLERHLIGMRGQDAHLWTAGKGLCVMDRDVSIVVDKCWYFIFDFTKSVVSIITTFFLLVFLNQNVHGVKTPITISFFTLIVGVAAINYSRHRNIHDLAKRKADWRVAWQALASVQIHATRPSAIPTLTPSAAGSRASISVADLHEGIKVKELDDMNAKFAEASVVYRNRSKHFGLLNMVARQTIQEVTFVAQTLLFFYSGYLAQQGDMTAGHALALLKMFGVVEKAMARIFRVLLGTEVGFVALKQMADVFNTRSA